MSGVYHLEFHNGPIDRTHWWKDLNSRDPSGCWRIYGKGIGVEGRIATDAEVDLWQQLTAGTDTLDTK